MDGKTIIAGSRCIHDYAVILAAVSESGFSISEVVLLKLADRIANMRYGLVGNARKYAMYEREYPEFRTALFREEHTHARPLWRYLDHMVDVVINIDSSFRDGRRSIQEGLIAPGDN